MFHERLFHGATKIRNGKGSVQNKHRPFAVYNGLPKIPLLENKLVIILYFARLIVSLQQKWLEIPISLRAIVLV